LELPGAPAFRTDKPECAQHRAGVQELGQCAEYTKTTFDPEAGMTVDEQLPAMAPCDLDQARTKTSKVDIRVT
jgi:hypothetical protein